MYYQEAKKYITESFKLSVSQWIGDGPRKKKNNITVMLRGHSNK